MATNDTQKSMNAQSSALDSLPERLSQVLAFAGLSQAELARRVGMSAGFISDVLRGVKRPGPDLLFTLRQELGVSIDWLLTGEGTMIGGAGIRHDLFLALRLQVAVTRAAVMDGNPIAKALLLLLREGRLDLSTADPSFRTLLEQLQPPDDDLDLVLMLYNGQQWASDPISQRRNNLAAAEAHFAARKPVDKLSALAGASNDASQTDGSRIQIITGSGNRIAGRNYIERQVRKK